MNTCAHDSPLYERPHFTGKRTDSPYIFRELSSADRQRYFWFPRDLVTSGLWADMPSSVRSVLPVLMRYAGQNRPALPSADTTATLAGINRATALDAYAYLWGNRSNHAHAFMSVARGVTRDGRRQYEFRFHPIVAGQGFPFRDCVFTGGAWNGVGRSAHSLYPVIRTFAKFDARYTDKSDGAVSANFPLRSYERWAVEDDVLMQYAGIAKSETLQGAVDDLRRVGLVEIDPESDLEADEEDGHKVFLTPSVVWTADELNG